MMHNYKLTILPVSGKVGIVPKTRNYKIVFRNTRMVSKVFSYVGNTQVANNCYTDDSLLVIEVDNVPTDSQLTIVCIGENIEIDALHIINEDIASIISALPIKTIVKQRKPCLTIARLSCFITRLLCRFVPSYSLFQR